MLGSIPYAKTRKTSFKLCLSVAQGHHGVSEKRETSMCVFISLVQLVKFILLLC